MVTVHIHRDFKIPHNHLIFLILGDHAKVRRAFALGVPFVGSQFMQRFSLAILFILFFAVIFMAWWVAKRISKPLLKLAEDAVQMGKGQKINHITPDPSSCTEIIALTDSLNKMRADINKMIKEREDFLAEISHDLRTPLSRLRMGIEMLKSDSSKFIEGLKEDIYSGPQNPDSRLRWCLP